MTDPRLHRVAEGLLLRTEAGRLRWQAGAKPKEARDDWEPGTFVTRLQHGSAAVSAETPQGRYPYDLHVRDPAGTLIGELRTGDEDAWLGDREPEAWEQALARLFELARRSALNTTASLDAVVQELSD